MRISSGRGGHYSAAGQINGSPVEFLIDTGATTVALSGEHAQRLGINYLAGKPTLVSTASGGLRPTGSGSTVCLWAWSRQNMLKRW